MGIGSFGQLTLSVSLGVEGDVVIINNTGTGFYGTMIVKVDGVESSSVIVLDHNQLSFIVPNGSGICDVYVEAPADGDPVGENITLLNAWEYEVIATVNLRSGIINDGGDENRLAAVNNYGNPDEDRYI